MNATDTLSAARLRVANRLPYLADVLLSLRPVQRPDLGTLAVDAGWRLHYDPEIALEWGVDGLSTVIAHEVHHCLLEHFSRRGGRDPERWNRAGDRAINCGLIAAGWKFLVTPLLPAQIQCADGETAEHYYDREPEQSKQYVCCGGCAGNSHEWEENEALDPGSAPGSCSGAQGSALSPPISATDQQILRRLAAQKITEHEKANGRGSVPGILSQWAECELEPPRVPWQRMLASLIRAAVAEKAGQSDYTYSRPSRRQWGMRSTYGMRAPIMPALRQPLPDVAVCLDVSGSMGAGEDSPAAAARAEIMGIVRAVGCPVWTYAADTQVADQRRIGGRADIARLGDTSGGTSMANALKEISQKRKHDIVICLTDNYTDWPETKQPYRLIVCIVGDNQGDVPSWATAVRVEQNQ